MIKRDIPKIRFYSYQGAWVEKRIADIVKISAGGDVDKERLKESGKYPVIANALTNKGIVGFYDDYKVKAPAVTVTGRGDVGYAVARHENFTPIVRLLTLQSENIDVDYLENQINSMRILNESTGVPQLTAPQLGNYKVYHPEIDEQSAIGSLFRTLDVLLASYKVNLANYQSLKASMISKMFPKAGQTIPEIRLDGFEGEWGNAIINDYVTLLNGRAFKQDELLNEGKYRVVRVGNFNTNEKWYYSNLELEENKYANKDDLLYLWATNFGPEIWKEEKIIFHYHIWKLEFDRSIIDRNYLYYWLEKDKKRIQQNTNGSTMVHVTKSMMENREFLFPMFREQQAIGSYFSNLDNLINSHQEKISQLETLKKKLLQDMFI